MKKDKELQESALKSYFEQIKKKDLLSFEQEIDLSRRIQMGDCAAQQRLIESNLRLVVKIAKNFVKSDIALLDLIQEGNLGLIKAASKYDFRKNVRFSTYASWWIKQAIVRAISNKRRAIRLPHRKEEILRKIQKVYNSLSQELMREPCFEEVASEVGLPEEDVRNLMHYAYNVVSLEGGPSDEQGCIQDIFEDCSYMPDEELLKKSFREDTEKCIEDALKSKEREIIMYRFSFYGGKRYTLKNIGDKMGISPETVRQIEIRALRKLGPAAEDLREYVYN